ncbi:MAG: CAP domain-containing protein [candidate division WOR-3 bacterium]
MPFFLLVLSVSLTKIQVNASNDTIARMISIYPEIEGNDSVEALIFKLTNKERKIRGLKALKKDKRLTMAARQHSSDMLKNKYLSHSSSSEINRTPLQRIYNSGLPVLAVGENVAENFGSSVPSLLRNNPDSLAQIVMKEWMDSPSHRKNILDPDFSHMGVGSVSDENVHKVTQNFADESDFAVDSIIAKAENDIYLILFYLSSRVSNVRVFYDGKPLEDDSVYVYSGLIGLPLKKDASLHKIELCLKEDQFYRCGVRVFVHTGIPIETIIQPTSSSYK